MHHLIVSAQAIAVDSSADNTNKSVASLLRLYKDSLSIRQNDTLVVNEGPLTKALPESTLGNLFAEAMRQIHTYKKIDIAIVNYGSIGIDYVAPGPLLRKDFYKMIPYEDDVILISLSGKELQILCDSIAQHGGLPVAGLKFTIDNSLAQKVLINEKTIHPNLVYTLALNKYLFKSKMFQTVFLHKNYKPTGFSLRKSVMNYVQEIGKNGQHLKIILDNRISYAE